MDIQWEILVSKTGDIKPPLVGYVNGSEMPNRDLAGKTLEEGFVCIGYPDGRYLRIQAKDVENAVIAAKSAWEKLIESGRWS